MKKNFTTSFIFILLFLFSAGAQEKQPRIKLGAYYYAGWGGQSSFDNGKPENAWAKNMPLLITKKLVTEFSGRTPLWGWRDDTPEIMQRQINIAADNGIAFFSFCWYWRENKKAINIEAIENHPMNNSLNLFMESPTNERMEFCLMVANHENFEITGTEAWKEAADYWISIFKHPRYLQYEGKPLLVIYEPQGADTKGLAYLQETARKAGFPGVAVVCCGEGKIEDGFSLTTRYNYVPGYHKPSERHTYKELADQFSLLWKGSPEQPCIPLMTAGWDRRPWEAPDGLENAVPTSWYFDERTPELFGSYLLKMTHWMDAHPEQVTKDRLALIYAWNELGEGGWLVPCRDDPDGAYLKEIRKIVYQ